VRIKGENFWRELLKQFLGLVTNSGAEAYFPRKIKKAGAVTELDGGHSRF
jgi:hypothetical protein